MEGIRNLESRESLILDSAISVHGYTANNAGMVTKSLDFVNPYA